MKKFKMKDYYLIAVIKRFFHCLIHLHCMWDEYDGNGRHTYMSCYECKRKFWSKNEKQKGD